MLHPTLGVIAPVIPEFGALVGLMFAVLGVMMARGAISTWTHSFGFMLEWLAGQLQLSFRVLGHRVAVDLGGPFRAVDRAVLHAFQAWLAGSEIELTYFLHASEHLWHWTASQIEGLAVDTLHAAHWLRHTYVPTIVHTIVRPVHTVVHAVEHRVATVVHTVTHTIERVRIIEHETTHTVVRVIRKAVPVVLPGAHAIPWLKHEVHGLTRRNLRIHKRLHRLEALFGVTAMAAAMANVFGLPNWRCLTRGNIGRAARHFCGLDKWLVDLLLLGSVEAFVATDMCEFTHLLGIAAKAERPALMELVSVENALIGCHGTARPMTFALPSAELPPLQGASPLAV